MGSYKETLSHDRLGIAFKPATEVPSFGVMELVSFDYSNGSPLAVTQQVTVAGGEKTLYINGIGVISPTGHGWCTRGQTPVKALYDTDDGTPQAGETWGPKSNTWVLGKGIEGFTIQGDADTQAGTVWVSASQTRFRRYELKEDLCGRCAATAYLLKLDAGDYIIGEEGEREEFTLHNFLDDFAGIARVDDGEEVVQGTRGWAIFRDGRWENTSSSVRVDLATLEEDLVAGGSAKAVLMTTTQKIDVTERYLSGDQKFEAGTIIGVINAGCYWYDFTSYYPMKAPDCEGTCQDAVVFYLEKEEESEGDDSGSGSDSGSISGSISGGGDDSGSGKDTAIVPAPWIEGGGYVALFVDESPEVRFNDIIVAKIKQKDGSLPLDFRYIAVCEPGSIEACGYSTDLPVLVGMRVRDGRLKLQFAEQRDRWVRLVVRLTGIRNGFAGVRFPLRTREEFDANERFINMARQYVASDAGEA